MNLGNARRGMSLLEVTVASVMASVLAVLAAGISVDLSRHAVGNLTDTRLAAEIRFATECLRRDLGGSSPDRITGSRDHWRLVGTMLPSSNELRLCFDSSDNAGADWIAPDLVITYSLSDGQLIRTSNLSGEVYPVANFVDDFVVGDAGGQLNVTIDFQLADLERSVTLITEDLP